MSGKQEPSVDHYKIKVVQDLKSDEMGQIMPNLCAITKAATKEELKQAINKSNLPEEKKNELLSTIDGKGYVVGGKKGKKKKNKTQKRRRGQKKKQGKKKAKKTSKKKLKCWSKKTKQNKRYTVCTGSRGQRKSRKR